MVDGHQVQSIDLTTNADAGVRLGVVYPSDPAGTIPGGIETFIRGIINWAPPDFSVDVIGVTTDPVARPVGQWTTVNLGRGSYRCLPLFAIGDPGRQSRFPASLQHLIRLVPRVGEIRSRYNVVDMHRIEPAVLFNGRDTALNAYFHQNMGVLHSEGSDIRWRHFPGLYFRLERWLMGRLASVYAVREDAVTALKERYPEMAEKFRFTPTWYDPERFTVVDSAARRGLRHELLASAGVSDEHVVFASVGRLDTQKNPLMLVEAFAAVHAKWPNTRLLMIGDGVLRGEVERRVGDLGLGSAVIMAGLVDPSKVASYLQASDIFALSSVYEGMPMCVLEALGCGLPAATTRVGEVAQVVKNGVSGYIAEEQSAPAFAEAMEQCLLRLDGMAGESCVGAAADFVPGKVLETVFENYRRLARRE